jgi:DNA-binding MarR family transcriptional regulator
MFTPQQRLTQRRTTSEAASHAVTQNESLAIHQGQAIFLLHELAIYNWSVEYPRWSNDELVAHHLLTIIANAEHPLSRREIASHTHFSNCAMTGALCVLLHHDFLTQSTPEPADGESVLSLTPSGREEFERLWSWPQFLLAFIPHSSLAALTDLIPVLTRQWHQLFSSGTMPSWKICVNCSYFTTFRQPTDITSPHHCAIVLRLDDSDYIRKPSTTLIPSLKQ